MTVGRKLWHPGAAKLRLGRCGGWALRILLLVEPVPVAGRGRVALALESFEGRHIDELDGQPIWGVFVHLMGGRVLAPESRHVCDQLDTRPGVLCLLPLLRSESPDLGGGVSREPRRGRARRSRRKGRLSYMCGDDEQFVLVDRDLLVLQNGRDYIIVFPCLPVLQLCSLAGRSRERGSG